MSILNEKSSIKGKTKSNKTKSVLMGNCLKFEAGFVSVILFGMVIFLVDYADKGDGYFKIFMKEIILVNVIVIFYQWTHFYISSLTREKRALFDEENILETYQPRAYTHGHLFVPDPPTPAELEANDMKIKRTAAEKSAFNQMRDSHYENMYQKALELSQAIEAEEKAAKKSSNKASYSSNESDGNDDKNKNNKDNKNSLPKRIEEDDIIRI
uniref:Transmembrane protein n=1 Tax=Parastrongyloides trichosuri TaxID=131310 RepID=A0A0N4ZPZ3_PARTI